MSSSIAKKKIANRRLDSADVDDDDDGSFDIQNMRHFILSFFGFEFVFLRFFYSFGLSTRSQFSKMVFRRSMRFAALFRSASLVEAAAGIRSLTDYYRFWCRFVCLSIIRFVFFFSSDATLTGVISPPTTLNADPSLIRADWLRSLSIVSPLHLYYCANFLSVDDVSAQMHLTEPRKKRTQKFIRRKKWTRKKRIMVIESQVTITIANSIWCLVTRPKWTRKESKNQTHDKKKRKAK